MAITPAGRARQVRAAKRAAVALVVLLVWCGLMINWWFEFLRLTSPRLNYLLMVVVFALPLFTLVLVWRTPSDTVRAAGVVVLVPLCVASTVLLAGTLFLLTAWIPDALSSDIDPSFERLRSVFVGDSEVVAYRTNGGATTSFGIVIREEKAIFPGLRLVRRLYSKYPAADVSFDVLSSERVRCVFPPYREDAKSKEVVLRL